MTTPTITISVSGVPVAATSTAIPSTPVAGMATATAASSEVSTKSLYMAYVQAVKGDKREQFIVFPPAVETLGVLGVTDKWTGVGKRLLALHRTQSFSGNRSKWFEKYFYTDTNQTLLSDLDNLTNRGYEIGGLVVVPLEVDDYVKVYNGITPTKAIRAIDRALKTIGLSIK